MFNTVIKVVDMPKIEEKKPPAPTEGKEELAFGLFEQAEKETPPPAEKSKYELIKCLFGQSEGRTAHNNGRERANGMASNTWKPCV